MNIGDADMASILKAGQTLKGRLSTYTLTKELHRAADDGVVFLANNLDKQKCIIKGIAGHWRLQNEADILKRYQDKTPYLRPLVDEIQEPAEPPSIVLRYLDTDLLRESNKQRLSRPEIKQVAKATLQALKVLHEDGLVHTDIKLDNIFINYGSDGQRFSDIQLGDCGGAVPEDSKFAKESHLIGAGISRSPEVIFEIGWGTPTDIWSFGSAIISLIYGGDYHMFNPANEGVGIDDDIYAFTILKRMYRVFGPFPPTYEDFAERNSNLLAVINIIHDYGIPEKPFHRISPIEVSPADKNFILKIMKLDPRDRPTAQQLLDDEWFTEESEDTRMPLEEYYEVIRQRNASAKAAKEASEASNSAEDEGSNTSRDSEQVASQGIQVR